MSIFDGVRLTEGRIFMKENDILKENEQLTQNFRINEFTDSTTYRNKYNRNLPITRHQFHVYRILCENILQPIRSHVGRVISINSGLRTWELNNMLRDSGFRVSTTSDHLVPEKIVDEYEFNHDYGNDINTYKFKIQKEYDEIINPFGSGAADFVVRGFSGKEMFELYQYIVKNFKDFYNQVIFYPESNSKFIHVSNARNKIFPFYLESNNPEAVLMDGWYQPFKKVNKRQVLRKL